ncbi:Maf family protein [Rhodohalobacter mucosus]|uniref:dTTP/UTP pyrophosphatase n=1 Tax=Rhodohalobacter mucosus TaxID=2079485 RepID=A0A316TV52_9BACT|nr:Maf family protein [Rhodohalobacter mucosus]PWN07139.1 septum formation protein Maf [Rhodohalobacter mucosus]
MKIILASASPRRAQLFRQMNLEFETDPSGLDEVIDPALAPSDIVISLAEQKGRDVSARHQNSLVIAADTIVVAGSDILGKPVSEKEAAEMLSGLSGSTHEVFSGVWAGTLGHNGAIEYSFSLFERTKVTFSPLTQEEIAFYVQTGSPMDKAGAYGIQDDLGALFIREISGDYYNVVGFPMNAFYQKLKAEMPAVHKEIFLHLIT